MFGRSIAATCSKSRKVAATFPSSGSSCYPCDVVAGFFPVNMHPGATGKRPLERKYPNNLPKLARAEQKKQLSVIS